MSTESVLVTEPKKKKTKAWVIGAAALLIVIAGGSVGYAKYDMFKSPKTVYLQSELTTFNDLSKSINDSFKDYQEYMKPYLQSTVHNQSEISGDIIPPDRMDSGTRQAMELFKQSKLLLDSQTDQKNRKAFTKLDLNIGGNNLLEAQTYVDNDKIYIGFPDFYSKFALIDLSESKQIEQKYHINHVPSKLVRYDDLIQAIDLNDKLTPIGINYGKWFAEQLKDNQFSMKKGVDFSVGDGSISTKEITLTFKEDEFKSLLKGLNNKLANDDKMFELIYSKYENLAKLAIDNGTPVEMKDKSSFKSDYQKSLSEANNNIDKIKLAEDVKMTLNIDGNHHIINRKINISAIDAANEKSDLTMNFGSWDDHSKKHHMEISFKGNDARNTGGEFQVATTSQKESSMLKGTFLMKAVNTRDNQTYGGVTITSDYSSTDEKGNQKGDIKFSLKEFASGKEKEVATGNSHFELSKNDKEKSQNSDLSFDIKIGNVNPNTPKGFNIHIKSKDTFSDSFNSPTIDQNNSFDVATVTPQQEREIQMELQRSMQSFYLKNMNLLRGR
ncbi:MAG TPA: DUF6583 family protein [Bacillota bacterium]|nr:DUF6583 family protein [Bacillota bacterium]